MNNLFKKRHSLFIINYSVFKYLTTYSTKTLTFAIAPAPVLFISVGANSDVPLLLEGAAKCTHPESYSSKISKTLSVIILLLLIHLKKKVFKIIAFQQSSSFRLLL